MAASHFSQRAMSRHDLQATSRARPFTLRTHATTFDSSRRWAMSSDEMRPVRGASLSSLAEVDVYGSEATMVGQSPGWAAGTMVRVGPAQCVADTVGNGDTTRQGTLARRARSTAMSRACHVGLRSSWSRSSCSSRTTTAAMFGHGAHTALRAPTTTSTPSAARCQSSGTRCDAQPLATKCRCDGARVADTRTHDECATTHERRLQHPAHGACGGPHDDASPASTSGRRSRRRFAGSTVMRATVRRRPFSRASAATQL